MNSLSQSHGISISPLVLSNAKSPCSTDERRYFPLSGASPRLTTKSQTTTATSPRFTAKSMFSGFGHFSAAAPHSKNYILYLGSFLQASLRQFYFLCSVTPPRFIFSGFGHFSAAAPHSKNSSVFSFQSLLRVSLRKVSSRFSVTSPRLIAKSPFSLFGHFSVLHCEKSTFYVQSPQ